MKKALLCSLILITTCAMAQIPAELKTYHKYVSNAMENRKPNDSVVFDYLRNTFQGKEVVVSNIFINEYDVNTNEKLDLGNSSVSSWMCLGPAYDKKFKCKILLLLQSLDGKYQTYIDGASLCDRGSIRVRTKEEWSQLMTKYKKQELEDALSSIFSVYRPTGLLVIAKGEPNEIRKLEGDGREMWIYDIGSFFVKDGIVIDWLPL